VSTGPTPDARRGLPRVDELADAAIDLTDRPRPEAVVREAARRVLATARAGSDGTGPTPAPAELLAALHAQLEAVGPLRRVLNATGVLLHTNLGRAPLAPAGEPLVEGLSVGEPPVGEAGPAGSVDLEFDLSTGRRGHRLVGLGASLCALTGAEAALVVNNNAAAVLLAVSGLAAGREVVVSRGQLVEIGGSFRVPEVIAQGGARLVEVGTTNRTHPADYRAALGEATAAVLEVHPSNYRVEGFTASVPTVALAGIAHAAGLPLVVDLGAGLVDAACPWLPGGAPGWLADEPGVAQTLRAGADLVTFSGDKLLGGPQAGIIVGRADLLGRLSSHPLARAVRFDRSRAGLLQSVVDAHLERTAATVVPFWRMATAPTGVLEHRAAAIVGAVADGFGPADSAGTVAGAGFGAGRCTIRRVDAVVGAGSAPGARIDDVAVRVDTASPDGFAAALRRHRVPVVAVVRDGATWLHLRTVDPADDPELTAAISTALLVVAAAP